MSSYRDQMAAQAPTYESGQALLQDAQKAQERRFGWVNERFYEVYPGGRCIDWTNTLAPTPVPERTR